MSVHGARKSDSPPRTVTSTFGEALAAASPSPSSSGFRQRGAQRVSHVPSSSNHDTVCLVRRVTSSVTASPSKSVDVPPLRKPTRPALPPNPTPPSPVVHSTTLAVVPPRPPLRKPFPLELCDLSKVSVVAPSTLGSRDKRPAMTATVVGSSIDASLKRSFFPPSVGRPAPAPVATVPSVVGAVAREKPRVEGTKRGSSSMEETVRCPTPVVSHSVRPRDKKTASAPRTLSPVTFNMPTLSLVDSDAVDDDCHVVTPEVPESCVESFEPDKVKNLRKRPGPHFVYSELIQRLRVLTGTSDSAVPPEVVYLERPRVSPGPVDLSRTPSTERPSEEVRAVSSVVPDFQGSRFGVSPPPAVSAKETARIEQLTYCQQVGLFVRTCRELSPTYLPVDIYARWYPVLTKLSGDLLVEVIQAFYPVSLIAAAASSGISSDSPPRPHDDDDTVEP